MKARLYIAALHFNENSYRDQAVNKNGEPIYSISYPKGRKGVGIPKEVKVQQTYNYVLVTMEEVVKVRLELGSYRNSRSNREAAMKNYPAPIADSYPHVPKTELVERHIYKLPDGYLKPQYCWERKAVLILLTKQDGRILLLFLPSHCQIHRTKRRYARCL